MPNSSACKDRVRTLGSCWNNEFLDDLRQLEGWSHKPGVLGLIPTDR